MPVVTYPILHDLAIFWCHPSSQVVGSMSPPLFRWLFGTASTNKIWSKWHYSRLQVQSFKYWQSPHLPSWKAHFWNPTTELERPHHHMVVLANCLSWGPSQEPASTTSYVSKNSSRGYLALAIESLPSFGFFPEEPLDILGHKLVVPPCCSVWSSSPESKGMKKIAVFATNSSSTTTVPGREDSVPQSQKQKH